MNKIAAAAVTPGRRVTIGGDDRGESPVNTPLRGGVAGDGPLDAVTPMRKVPILANFEEWMKLATDNVCLTTFSFSLFLFTIPRAAGYLLGGVRTNDPSGCG